MDTRRKFTKIIIGVTSAMILSLSFSPALTAEAQERNKESMSVNKNEQESFNSDFDNQEISDYVYNSKEFNDFYQVNLIENNVNNEQLQQRGLLGGSLKAIKAVGWICRVGGKSLKYLIKPLSPSKAKLVDKYARKIAYATERLTGGSRSLLVKGLKKAGVPGKSAESLADIILWII